MEERVHSTKTWTITTGFLTNSSKLKLPKRNSEQWDSRLNHPTITQNFLIGMTCRLLELNKKGKWRHEFVVCVEHPCSLGIHSHTITSCSSSWSCFRKSMSDQLVNWIVILKEVISCEFIQSFCLSLMGDKAFDLFLENYANINKSYKGAGG